MEHAINTLVKQFEQGSLTRRQLVQGLLAVAAVPAMAQERRPGLFRATGIDHVQITVRDVKASREFYEKLFDLPVSKPDATQASLKLGTAGDYVSVLRENGQLKPIDHFGIAVENFSADAAMAAIERAMPGTKTEKAGNTIYVTGPEDIRLQIVAATQK